jgi:hypothetical protein
VGARQRLSGIVGPAPVEFVDKSLNDLGVCFVNVIARHLSSHATHSFYIDVGNSFGSPMTSMHKP